MIGFAIAAFSAVFSVVDPFGVVPLYVTMTAHDPPAHRRRTAVRASITMALALMLFAVAGKYILSFFGISIAAFRIAGGILLFLLAVDMLRAQPSRQRTTPEEEKEGIDRPDVSIFPLAIPMMSGPGAFATVMLLMTRATHTWDKLVVLGAILANAIVACVILMLAPFAERRLGKTGMNVLHRIMGFLLAAIAVQFVVDGTREVMTR